MNLYVINFLFLAFSVLLLNILILLKRRDEMAQRWLYFICSFLEIERRKVFWLVWPIAWFVMLMSLFKGETVVRGKLSTIQRAKTIFRGAWRSGLGASVGNGTVEIRISDIRS